MDIPDLIQRYYAHLNEYLADWEIPACLHYVPQGEGQEPTFRLCDADKCFYLVWLLEQAYITKAEWRWLWDDIDTQEAGLVACVCCQAPNWSECPCTRVHCPHCGRCSEHCRCTDAAAREA
jgi:hypothetical protein